MCSKDPPNDWKILLIYHWQKTEVDQHSYKQIKLSISMNINIRSFFSSFSMTTLITGPSSDLITSRNGGFLSRNEHWFIYYFSLKLIPVLIQKHDSHGVKRVCIRSYSGPHFSQIFTHSDWIRRDTSYLSVFSQSAGKSGKIADQNNSEYELFLRSEWYLSLIPPLTSRFTNYLFHPRGYLLCMQLESFKMKIILQQENIAELKVSPIDCPRFVVLAAS